MNRRRLHARQAEHSVGYHFKSIAAAGPIVGAIVAAILWGWLPAMIWLIGRVAFTR